MALIVEMKRGRHMRDISEGIINRTQVDKYCTGGGGGGGGLCEERIED